VRFIEGVQPFAPDARWMKSESLHVTLKFIGEQPDSSLDQITAALRGVSATGTAIHFRGYGFFPTAKSARVFWIGMEAGPGLAALAADIDEKTATLGIPKEDRVFSPHLTLARGHGGSGSPRHLKTDRVNNGRLPKDRPVPCFQRLQEKLAALPAPEFGTMTPREFFLYQSELSPKGSKYTQLQRFALRP
jgi:2'-5' RNA ligase